MPIFRVKSVKIYTGQKKFTRVYPWLPWQIWGMGRTWQPFVGSKNGNENFRQARIYNFCVNCVVFARNRKFAKLTQWNVQYILRNSALVAQETLFLTPKGTFFDLQKVRKWRQILIRDKRAYVLALNFRPSPNFWAGAPCCKDSFFSDPEEATWIRLSVGKLGHSIRRK